MRLGNSRGEIASGTGDGLLAHKTGLSVRWTWLSVRSSHGKIGLSNSMSDIL